VSPAAGAIRCGAVLSVLAVAGCGATASIAQREARCVDKNWDASSYVSIPVDDSAWHQAIRRICGEAGRERKLGSGGGLSRSELAKIVRNHPRVAYPLCTNIYMNARAYQLNDAQAKYLPARRIPGLARHYCDVVFGSGLATDSDGFTDADKDKLSREHPELLTPSCIAGAEGEYDQERQHHLSRKDFRKVMVFVCTESARQGYVSLSGRVDKVSIRALSRRATLRLIRQGRIHVVG
jgi:hypothetical protein